MKLTKDNIYEFISQAKQGDKIHIVSSGNIRHYRFLCKHKKHKGFYAYNDADVTEAILISEYMVERTACFTDYDEAKLEYYECVLNKLKSVNEIYLNNEKDLSSL